MATASKRKRTEEPVTDLNGSKPWKMSDVVIVVEDKKSHVHRNVLALWSPVFEKMFTSKGSWQGSCKRGSCAVDGLSTLKRTSDHKGKPGEAFWTVPTSIKWSPSLVSAKTSWKT